MLIDKERLARYRRGESPYLPGDFIWSLAAIAFLIVGALVMYSLVSKSPLATCLFPDAGVERLAKPASAKSGPLSITVTSVKVGKQMTTLDLKAANSSNDTITMPLLAAQLGVPGYATLPSETCRAQWNPEEVAPKAELIGSIGFRGTVPPETKKLTLSFTDVFTGSGLRSISVEITLT